MAERVAFFCGLPGRGKSFLARTRHLDSPRSLVIDRQPESDYPGLVIDNEKDLLRFLSKNADPAKRWRVKYVGPVTPRMVGPVGVVPVDGSFLGAFTMVDRYLLTVEEADKYGDGTVCPAAFYSIAHHGRVKGQALSLVARRPANVAKNLTAVADGVYVFRLGEPADLNYFHGRAVPRDAFNNLGEHGSLRCIYSDAGIPTWSRCECGNPHLGPCETLDVGPAGR